MPGWLAWARPAGLTLAAFYALGIVAAVVVALVLKSDAVRGPSPPFLMELPSYQVAVAADRVARMLQRGWVFLRSAGTLILAISIVVWAALYWPHDPHGDQRHSVLGRLGQVIEPAVRPLGWDWRIGCAVLASFPQREGVLATLGVMYNRGEKLDVESAQGQSRLQVQLRRHLGGHPSAGVHRAGSPVDHGLFRPLCPMCGHLGGDSPRDEQLALAGVYVRLHDRVGLRRGAGYLSGGKMVGVVVRWPQADHEASGRKILTTQ